MITEEYKNVMVSWVIRKKIEQGYAVINIWHLEGTTFVTYQQIKQTKP